MALEEGVNSTTTNAAYVSAEAANMAATRLIHISRLYNHLIGVRRVLGQVVVFHQEE